MGRVVGATATMGCVEGCVVGSVVGAAGDGLTLEASTSSAGGVAGRSLPVGRGVAGLRPLAKKMTTSRERTRKSTRARLARILTLFTRTSCSHSMQAEAHTTITFFTT